MRAAKRRLEKPYPPKAAGRSKWRAARRERTRRRAQQQGAQ